MEDSSKMINYSSVVTIGAIKNKDRRQNGILNRAINKTEYQSIACYCVEKNYYNVLPALRNISVRMPNLIVH